MKFSITTKFDEGDIIFIPSRQLVHKIIRFQSYNIRDGVSYETVYLDNTKPSSVLLSICAESGMMLIGLLPMQYPRRDLFLEEKERLEHIEYKEER